MRRVAADNFARGWPVIVYALTRPVTFLMQNRYRAEFGGNDYHHPGANCLRPLQKRYRAYLYAAITIHPCASLSAGIARPCAPENTARPRDGSGWRESYFSRITGQLTSRAALMCPAASSAVSFHCSPVAMSLTEQTPSLISSSPSRTAKGTPSLLA